MDERKLAWAAVAGPSNPKRLIQVWQNQEGQWFAKPAPETPRAKKALEELLAALAES